jgi:hypothetical protein
MLHSCTPLALWNTSSGTEAAPLVALTFLADSVFLEIEQLPVRSIYQVITIIAMGSSSLKSLNNTSIQKTGPS